MDRMIYTSMTGANAAAHRQAVLSHNLANASTQGFRAEMSTFRSVPLQGSGSTTRVFALEATSGHSEVSGPVTRTGRNLDAMAMGNAWFAVQGLDGTEAYTRNGGFEVTQAGQLVTHTRVTSIEPDSLNAPGWQLRTEGPAGSQHVYAGFDAVLLAQPSVPAQALLASSSVDTPLTDALSKVAIAPCWTLMLAYPNAVQPTLPHLGPQWNAALSTHHRIAWLARESSKPGRNVVERWTVQASPAWSAEHLEDDEASVQAKLLKAFAEVTGIRAEPTHADTRRWRYAQTTHPLGKSHLWDAKAGLGACGDWCLGHRLEDAFVSGLELALAVA